MIFIVVFDTNVLFSAIGWRGAPFQCLQLALQRRIVGVVCSAVVRELLEKLQTKLSYTRDEAITEVAGLLQFFRIVDGPGELTVVERDPDDNPVLECAVVAGAQYLVTGDRRHLLPIGSYEGVRIITSNQLLAIINASQNGHV